MHLRSLKIRNFRALEDIQVEFDRRVSVIVGPNAIGKTTVLEAIRLAKALIVPRTPNETTQTLFSLGASSPHFPQRLRIDSLATDPNKPVVISCRFSLSDEELATLEGASEQISLSLVQSRLGQAFASAGALLGYLSSPMGVQQLGLARGEVKATLAQVKASKQCHFELTVSRDGGLTSTGSAVEASFIGFLEQRLPPHQTWFTYFPADRALPAGEQPVQLGAADAAQQLESYNSQPQTKYARLKNLIFSASIMSAPQAPASGSAIQKEFEQIFNGILKGRKLVGVGINEVGLLTVKIQDTESGRQFDLDGMSSGEKGLILTFLLIDRSVAPGGVILLDEPELHLNPAVCKDLLSYMVGEYVVRKNLQVIVCSHSPEILAGAFDSEECNLYHLISGTNLSKVRRQDQAPLSDALRRLGASESDDLLFRGVVFVEGEDDVAILDAGFGQLLRRYRLKESRGRKEIEKAIKSLQEEESRGVTAPVRFFIFDSDEEPTNLRSSQFTRVLQWDRRCLENYLIDLDAIANLLMDKEVAKVPLKNHGEVSKLLRETAFRQLDELSARRVYEKYGFEGVGLRKDEIKGKPLSSIVDILYGRLAAARAQITAIGDGWKQEFLAKVAQERTQLEAVWETKWQTDCDGKLLLDDLRRAVPLNMDLRRFKTRIMREMVAAESETWKYMKGLLINLLTPSPGA